MSIEERAENIKGVSFVITSIQARIFMDENRKYFEELMRDKIENVDYARLDETLQTTDCKHEWVTTMGFSKQYIDCRLCEAKQEDSEAISEEEVDTNEDGFLIG